MGLRTPATGEQQESNGDGEDSNEEELIIDKEGVEA